MKTNYATITGTLADIDQWMIVLRQLTAGCTPKVSLRQDFQKFRWCMTRNHITLEGEQAKIRERLNAERSRILAECCGEDSEKRLQAYTTAVEQLKLAFCARDQQGKPCHNGQEFIIPSNKQEQFEARAANLNAAYDDVGRAHEAFSVRQQEIMTEPVSVKLICVDYDEIPDDVGCSYLSFIEKIIMGKPRLRFWHAVVARRARQDKVFRAELKAKINRAMATLGISSVDAVYNALYGDQE